MSVETVVLLVRGLWALCFVSLYSKEGLNRFIAEWNAERNLIELCTAGSKADTELGGDPNQSPPQRNKWAKLFFRISPSAEESVSSGETGKQGNHSYDRFRRKGGSGEWVSEALYDTIKSRLIAGEFPMIIGAIKRAARGIDHAYSIINRLQSEQIIR